MTGGYVTGGILDIFPPFDGGAICCYYANPTIRNCILSGNSAYGYGGGLCAYGRYVGGYSPIMTIADCNIANNYAGDSGAGACLLTDCEVSTCVIRDNECLGDGGGIWTYGDMTISSSIICGNTAGNKGGGGYFWFSYQTINNCTFADNSAGSSGGAVCGEDVWDETYLVITNSILWDNAAENGSQVALTTGREQPAQLLVSYSDIQGGQGNVYVEPNGILDWNEGNLDSNPLFVDANKDDFHLQITSPCIDVGDPNCGPEPNERDIDGEPRVMRGRVDIGADEEAHEVCNLDKDYCYARIQEAIDDADNGDVIVVSTGTYTGSGNRDLDFCGKPITVRSTDPADWDVVEATVIDCNGTRSEPHRGFHFHSGEDADSVIAGLTITNGYGDVNEGYYVGGGVFCDANSSPTIKNCLISGNGADEDDVDGGGIACYNSASPHIIDCIITDNKAEWSGGISWYDSTATMEGCIISNNTAGSSGGAMYFYQDADVAISNCTISNNSADNDGGGMCNYQSDPNIVNTILWGNQAGGSGDQIRNYSGAPSLTYCDVQGGSSGQGNINSDPCFVGADANNFHLGAGSPCINRGDPNGDYAGRTDIDGDPRLVGSRADIGADEFTGPGVYNLDQQKWYDSMQGAIDDANGGDTIEVGPGTYYEAIDFKGKGITVQSTDYDDWSVVATTIIDGNGADETVTFDTSEGSSSRLKGFTITGGDEHGIYCDSDPTIQYCLIRDNDSAHDGAGMLMDNGADPYVHHCIFFNNSGDDGGLVARHDV
jgi:predicted outer membrane repeat protein